MEIRAVSHDQIQMHGKCCCIPLCWPICFCFKEDTQWERREPNGSFVAASAWAQGNLTFANDRRSFNWDYFFIGNMHLRGDPAPRYSGPRPVAPPGPIATQPMARPISPDMLAWDAAAVAKFANSAAGPELAKALANRNITGADLSQLNENALHAMGVSLLSARRFLQAIDRHRS